VAKRRHGRAEFRHPVERRNFTTPLAQATYTDTGSAAQHTLTANIPAVADADAYSTPIEYRLYAWGGTSATGSTHVNLASLSAKFVAVPMLEFDFTGVQDNAPLTALRRQHPSIALTSGLDFGSGVAPRGPGDPTNVGNEFNVAGFSTGVTIDAALGENDYLTFTVEPVLAAIGRLGNRLRPVLQRRRIHGRPASGDDQCFDDGRR
jgi:hypothetical protein